MVTDKKMMTYEDTGVDYRALDPFKCAAQQAAAQTAENIKRFGMSEIIASRGESCFLINTPWGILAHVEEGLGTKNLVADAFYGYKSAISPPNSYYGNIAQDTVAMIVNDMITVGALPISVAMHLAVGDSTWFKNESRSNDLIWGWKKACDMSGCIWGGGETPTLKGVVNPKTVVLSGSAIGIINPKSNLIVPENIHDGDTIIMLPSSGIHANGLTMARKIAGNLPNGYHANLSDGTTYGEALLRPTTIYVKFIEACFKAGVGIHYAVNITGHGWRKLMRAPQPFTYVIDKLPPQLPIFDFMQEHGPIDNGEAYGNLNMGAGFVIYVCKDQADLALQVAQQCGFDKAICAGHVTQGEKKVIIEPKGLEYEADTLKVR